MKINPSHNLAAFRHLAFGTFFLFSSCLIIGAPPSFMGEMVALNQAWAEASFDTHPSPSADQMILLHEDSPGDTKINFSATGGALRLGDKTYSHGIGSNSRCEIRVRLSRPAQRFVADIGIDRNVEENQPASAEFRVLVAGGEVFASGVMRPGDAAQSIDVPLGGAREFDLVIDDGGDGRSYDQGNWADARIVMADGTSLWLDELHGGPLPGVPFSFVYGGKPSAELLPTWKSESKDEKPDATRTVRTLKFTDPETGLVVNAVATIYLDTPGVDWTLHFTNTGSKPTPILENVRAVDVRLVPPLGKPVMLHRVQGCHHEAASWQPIEQALVPGTQVAFGAHGGRPAKVDSPFFTVDWGDGGVITAVGWSGQWNGSVASNAGGIVRIEAGMEFLHVSLQPGESIRSPRILQVYWQGGSPDEAHNQFRRTMLAHIVPKRDGKPVFPPIAHLSTSFYELNATDEASTLSHLAAIDGLGFEALWLDAYWHRDGFPAGIGNYGFPLDRVSDPVRFPRGLRPVTDAVHKKGLKFLLWFEPERVSAGTDIAREHPDWLINVDGDQGFNSELFNLGNPEAREFMTSYLKAAIKEYGVDILRFDYNIDPLPFWQEENRKNPDRVGISEIRYVEGLYHMWDELRSEFPKLDIDNCASGGMRVDLETVSRSLTLWRTDYTIEPLLRKDYEESALRNQVMTAGLNRYLPFSVSGQMGSSPYLFRSGFNGGIAFCEDTRPADYPREQLRDAIAEGKRLRKYYTGDFYRLSDVTTDPRDWTVLQYHLPETGEGAVIGFRRPKSPFTAIQCELKGIDPAAIYEVTRSVACKPGAPLQMKGSELQKLSLAIPEIPGSVVLEYKKIVP
jgi:alpha-galactosidase